MFLIDTNIAVHVRDRTGNVRSRLLRLQDRPRLSLMTWIELEGGVAKAGDLAAQRRRAISRLTGTLEILPCDAPVVRAYADIIAATGFSRRRIIDRLIAATAIVHGLSLITMNEADFADVPGLRLEVWTAQ